MRQLSSCLNTLFLSGPAWIPVAAAQANDPKDLTDTEVDNDLLPT